MRIFIVAVNERLPDWAKGAVEEFQRRLPREWRFEIVEVRPERRHGQPVERIKAAEAQRLLERCGHARIVALDEHGDQITTRQLAEAIQTWQGEGRDIALLIGGADGLDVALLAQASRRIALSRLTLPHALARVLLVEQLYRAASLMSGHPYHRE